tara:strand:- start:4157 stop:4510 length:354 start_codon:yes stop_codon:yes gene_type:complete
MDYKETETIYRYRDRYPGGQNLTSDNSQKKLWINQKEMIVVKKLLFLAQEQGWYFVDESNEYGELNNFIDTLDTKLAKAISTFVAAGWLKPHNACKFMRKGQFLEKTFSEYEKNRSN